MNKQKATKKLKQKAVLKLKRITIGEEYKVDKDYIQKPISSLNNNIYVFLRKDYKDAGQDIIDNKMVNASRRAKLFWPGDFKHA